MVIEGAAVSSGWRMITGEWSVSKGAEIVVKGMIFLHDDDDVIDSFSGRSGREKRPTSRLLRK
jgi:hypothetical protein